VGLPQRKTDKSFASAQKRTQKACVSRAGFFYLHITKLLQIKFSAW